MPDYGLFKYGTKKYGATVKAGTRSTLFAQVVDYGVIAVEAGVGSRIGQTYSIVRTKSGAAEDPSAGVVVQSGTVASDMIKFIDGLDTGVVAVHSGMVYYTLFVYDDFGAWAKDATTSLISPRNRDTKRFFFRSLPGFYTSEDHNPIDPYVEDSDLIRFLYGFALTYDELAQGVDMILPDERNLSSIRRLHPAFARGLGMPDEYTIGTAASARLFREAGYIYRNKGTSSGISTYAEALTGWQNDVREPTNMLLSTEDAYFTPTSNWALDEADYDVNLTLPNLANNYTDDAFVKLGGAAGTTFPWTLNLPAVDERSRLIPVEAGLDYTFSVYSRSSTVTLYMSIDWRDTDGVHISTDTSSGISYSGSTWGVRSFTATAPAGAKFARLGLNATGATTVKFSYASFTQSSVVLEYHDPRSIDVICYPTRVNLIFDPTMTMTAGGWTVTAGTITSSTDKPLNGYESGKTSTGAWSAHSNDIPVIAGYDYIVTGKSMFNNSSASVKIKWFTSGDTLISTITQNFDSSTPDVWVTATATGIAPENAAYARIVVAGTDVCYLGGWLFERGEASLPFFTGGISDYTSQDSVWSGDPLVSYSLLYPSKNTKLSRLRATLPYYLPLGVVARVILWDSSDVHVQALVPNGA